MTISRYKDLVILLCCFVCVLLVIEKCNTDKKHNTETTDLENEIANLSADNMLILDSVYLLNEELELERLALPKRLNEYSKLPQTERIKLITKIDSFAIPTDTGAILSLHGVDSVNKLTLHYQSCVVQSAIKDTTIKHLIKVISNDSAQIQMAKTDFENYKQKEASRNKKTYWRGFKHGSGLATGLFAVINALF